MPTRRALLDRWATLTGQVLPGMAAEQRWPIRLDHCFMRVCLDAAVGAPWPTAVARPAVRHLTDAQLAAAVAIAEDLVAHPERLPGLDAQSLAWRRAARAASAAPQRPTSPAQAQLPLGQDVAASPTQTPERETPPCRRRPTRTRRTRSSS